MLRAGTTSGRNPEVDYTICGEGEKQWIIPAEVMITKDMKQLCVYTSKLGTCADFQGLTNLGLLTDGHFFRLEFVPCTISGIYCSNCMYTYRDFQVGWKILNVKTHACTIQWVPD